MFESAKDGILILDGDTGHIVMNESVPHTAVGFLRKSLSLRTLAAGFLMTSMLQSSLFTELKAKVITLRQLTSETRNGFVLRLNL